LKEMDLAEIGRVGVPADAVEVLDLPAGMGIAFNAEAGKNADLRKDFLAETVNGAPADGDDLAGEGRHFRRGFRCAHTRRG
jgi:hypothetical protein